MNRGKLQKLEKWWGPKLNDWSWKFWRPLRRRLQSRMQRLIDVQVQNPEVLQELLRQDVGVLLTPNHSAHADPFTMYGVADCVACPFYFMVAWEVFGNASWIRRLGLAHHGCFSVDREGTDMRALRQAMEILSKGRFPLVIFPEGEIYHLNERITPFREGASSVALMAAKVQRPIACLPVGIRYSYIEDPTPELTAVMDQLEMKLHWRPRPDLPLQHRIYRIAEGMLALKELEYLGQISNGTIPERVASLLEHVLQCVEQRHGVVASQTTIPERIKDVRRRIIKEYLEQVERPDMRESVQALERDLDDVFLVIQLFSYPGDYVAENPSIERIAETIDKFEEDGMVLNQASIRGTRRALIGFGEPIMLEPGKKNKRKPADLTRELEQQVQSVLDSLAD